MLYGKYCSLINNVTQKLQDQYISEFLNFSCFDSVTIHYTRITHLPKQDYNCDNMKVPNGTDIKKVTKLTIPM